MLGDVLLIEEKHKEAASAIKKEILAKKANKFIIAISGESGSGKSELAHSLAKLFKDEGIRAKPLHIDNYYKTLPIERNAWRKKHGSESIGYTEYDWDTIYNNIEAFKNGEKATMPCVDIVTDQVDTLITDFKEVDMLIIDGLYAIKTEGTDMNIFIDLTYNETKKAQLRRGKENVDELRMMVLQREHEVVTTLKERAHFIINKEYKLEKA
ncbi:MAG: uridine kinase [Bacteroidota bacterium]|nr:uridine kinase [Bacteroidota bacterium]